MGKKKIKIEQLKNQRTRQLTFTKRKTSLIKKAMELSILCNANIYLRISSPDISNDISIFSTEDPQSMLKIIKTDYMQTNNNESKINLYYKEQYHNLFTKGVKNYSVSTSSNSGTPSIEEEKQTVNGNCVNQNEGKDEVGQTFNVSDNNNNNDDIVFNSNIVNIDYFSETFTEISE
jgi:hypothetical protein